MSGTKELSNDESGRSGRLERDNHMDGQLTPVMSATWVLEAR